MPYTQKLWQDRIKDSQGKIIQEGTPFSAGNMNRIEQGIADAHASLQGAARQTQTLQHGVSVLNGDVNALLDVQIEGRTLIPMQNTVLDALKYYVLADKKTKLKWADASTTQGIAKFTGKAERPTLIRVANFEGKVAGGTLANPHIGKENAKATLDSPSMFSVEFTQNSYNYSNKLSDTFMKNSTTVVNGQMAQQLFSFNLIEEIERQIGKIPRSTLADKVQWCKNNIAKLTCGWWGYGSSVGGYKATLKVWQDNTSDWQGTWSHTSVSVLKLTSNSDTSVINRIDSAGFIHFLAYAEPSDGVTASTINTDYVELEIELKPEALLHQPRVPLYEVSKESYDNILVTWNENEVMNRYPSVEGVQHVQNPYMMVEGENLLPPFYEWTLHANAKVVSPYELELNATSGSQTSSVRVSMLPNQKYYIKVDTDTINFQPFIKIDYLNESDVVISSAWTPPTNTKMSFTTPNGCKKVNIYLYTNNAGTTRFTNAMLTLGNVEKNFIPRNPSYLMTETKLGSLNGVSDQLYTQDGKYLVRKAIEKDVVLDGNLNWLFHTDNNGYKRVQTQVNTLANVKSNNGIIMKYDGNLLRKSNGLWDNIDTQEVVTDGRVVITVSDENTGFADTYTPTSNEIKSYFNGWQVKTSDATGKPIAWKSIVDSTDAPTQTLAYVSANKASNYTPYKLSYQLATPIVEEIKVEGSLSVNGLTQLQIGSGFTYTMDKDGKRSYSFPKDPERVKSTVNITNVIATYANNIRSALDDTVKKVEDNAAAITVNANILYDVLKRLKAGGL